MGDIAEDEVRLRFTYTMPSDTDENVKACIYIAGNQIDHNGETYSTSYDEVTNWRVDNMEYKLETGPPEVITWSPIDGIGTESGKFKLAWSYSISKFGVGGSFSYTNPKQIDLNPNDITLYFRFHFRWTELVLRESN
ncbi:hypothetical protein SAMN04487944_1165 [Gracilibacillus ureilyticus]|uniref:Uncharacterized protein n=1 Tax=Gracilibacillus ureilyticus TaxID=531814 RepID=A0A1H9U513_9BACI|nr:hypothetical protein [Gracilibacillus ureilyticus]SES04328.1 hypothetical protein SAMN04487944_1165 [Gracilibacillus ureilyticus]